MYRITGHRPSASYSIAKLMWVRDNEPEIYASTAKSLQAKDYIVFKLTGRMVTDYSDASSTNAFDLNTLSWSDRIFEAAGVPPDTFPEAVASTEVVGEVTSHAAAETGIPQGTPVVMGAGDGGCATVGAGSVRPGISYNYIGSSSWIATTSKEPLYDPEMRTFNWAHPISGYYQPTGTMQTAGSSFRWLQEEICRSETEEAHRRGVSPYELINALAQESTPAGHGVLFLPYFMGERTPWWNPEAKGGFIGLRLDTKRADLVRAVIDGVALNLNFSLQAVRRAAEPSGMIVIGGGAKGAIWRQTLADVYGLQIQVPRYLEEATSLGAAVIAGVGVGVFPDFDVVDRINSIDSRIDPRPEYSDAYRHMQGLLEESYRGLEDVFPKLHEEPGRNG
jgi:xylulokinase